MNTYAKASPKRLTDLAEKISENLGKEAECALCVHQQIGARECAPKKAKKSNKLDSDEQWWRRRESNPRPETFSPRLTTCVFRDLVLAGPSPTDRVRNQRAGINLALRPPPAEKPRASPSAWRPRPAQRARPGGRGRQLSGQCEVSVGVYSRSAGFTGERSPARNLKPQLSPSKPYRPHAIFPGNRPKLRGK